MVSLHFLWPGDNASLLCIPPLLYLIGALGSSRAPMSLASPWQRACKVSAAVAIFSLACCAYAVWQWHTFTTHPRISSVFHIGRVHFSFRFDLLESLMLCLVTFLGWVIVNYSRAYMAGDPKELFYIRRLMLTLSAVTLLVVTNNLAVFLAAWIFTSLALHGLLTLYPTRQAAVIAAHKKFLASRMGDAALFAGVMLLGYRTGSFEIDQVVTLVTTMHPVPLSIHVAALLLALSAIIKCAQLPLHGWLIQVMEAPTPVSALLHAGIVNLGGFMLIRLAAVLNTTPAAQALLVIVGCLSAVIGSLVMTTRISIKVNLAWSTCAQMGFMLLECGLGLYALAFLHLLSHSLYKAYAFLGSGEAVNEARAKRSLASLPSPRSIALLASTLCGLVLATIAGLLWHTKINIHATSVLLPLIVGLAVAGLLAATRSAHSVAIALRSTGLALAISLLYFGSDALFEKLVPQGDDPAAQHPAHFFFVLACFTLLYSIQAIARLNPTARFVQTLHTWLYAGLYLDELFTRTTFRIWPAKSMPHHRPRRDAMHPFEATGESL